MRTRSRRSMAAYIQVPRSILLDTLATDLQLRLAAEESPVRQPRGEGAHGSNSAAGTYASALLRFLSRDGNASRPDLTHWQAWGRRTCAKDRCPVMPPSGPSFSHQRHGDSTRITTAQRHKSFADIPKADPMTGRRQLTARAQSARITTDLGSLTAGRIQWNSSTGLHVQ